ncbi:MAG: hypothetical protein ACRENE_18250, partial [Polyangiaceae bacterium]
MIAPPELSERALDLLRRYREAETLDAGHQARLLAAVQHGLAGGAAPGGGSGAMAGHGALAKALAGLGSKVVLGAIALAIPVALVVRARQAPPPAATSASAASPATGLPAVVPASSGPNVVAATPGAAMPAPSGWVPLVTPEDLVSQGPAPVGARTAGNVREPAGLRPSHAARPSPAEVRVEAAEVAASTRAPSPPPSTGPE